MERPFFFPLFSVMAGLSAGFLYAAYPPGYSVPILLFLTFCTLFVKSRIPFYIALSLLFFCVGDLSLKPFLNPQLPATDISNFCSEESVVIEGVIDSRPECTEQGFRLYVRAERLYARKSRQSLGGGRIGKDEPCSNSHPGVFCPGSDAYAPVTGRMLLSVKEGEPHFLTGDRVRFMSPVRKPRNLGLPGEFDRERHLAFMKIFATAFVKGTDDIIFIADSGEFSLRRRIDVIARELGLFITRSVGSTEGGILRALLLGEMGVVPKAMRDAYTISGVNHILSISGFHVGIIALFVFQILLLAAKGSEFLLLHFNMRRIGLILTFPFLLFYLLLSGAAPATLRAVIMIGVLVMALSLEREVDTIDSLMLAALVILVGSPPALFDLSFQLSFLAIWGILVLTPILLSPFTALEGKTWRKLLLFFMASAAAITATLLPVAFYFHRTTLTGLLSNFVIVPLLGYGAVVTGFTALPFVYFAPFIAQLLLLAAAFLVRVSNAIIVWLAKVPCLPPFTPSRLDLGIFFLFMMAVTFITSRKMRRAGCASLFLLFFVTSVTYRSPDRGKLVVTFLSVGQGDATLISFPNGRKMLVDGGGNPEEKGWDAGERLLAPALRTMGISRVDYLVLTHPHPDHMQGVRYVAANFPVGEFWEGGSYPQVREYQELRELLRRKQVPVRRLDSTSGPFAIDTTIIEPLAPLAGDMKSEGGDDRDMNDESLVLRLRRGNFALLLTGDICSDIEAHLIGRPELLRCTVLKVAHHGSRHSSSMAFLRAAAPQIAVVSVGYGNYFHLPASETLERVATVGARLYRTDLDGTVQVVCDSKGYGTVTVRTARHFH